MVFLATDRCCKDLLAIDSDHKLEGGLVPFNTDITFGNSIQEPTVEDVLAISGEDVLKRGAATSAEG